MAKSPYEVLGVRQGASPDEIKTAYRKLVKQYHPDSYKGHPLEQLAKEKMQEVNEAYESVTSPNSQYNRNGGAYGANGQGGSYGTNGANGQGQNQGGQGGAYNTQGGQGYNPWGSNQNPNNRGPYYGGPTGPGLCDTLSCLCCGDTCCECMGGDLCT